MALPLVGDLRRRSRAELSDERRRLGFARQPAVRWLSPSLLARSAAEVVVSGWFGRFADKREMQRSEPQGAFDIAAGPDGEVWLDFLSDTGDGWEATATMAWLLAQPALSGPGGTTLRRGDALMLGGDEVYPSASAEAYEDRFVGPFASAFPGPSDGDDPGPAAPSLFALPGNHDWYDGLTAFLRLFCQPGRLGGWRQQQARSYWALRLPHRWWVFAIDIQLDTYIDRGQLDYFRSLPVEAGDHVVLLTAKPSWVKVGRGEEASPSWRNLAYFEDKAIHARGARLAVALTGDLHHYSRYASRDGGPAWITAGGGGAYTSPTHTLPPGASLELRDERTIEAELCASYPSADESRARRAGVLKLPFTNPPFARLMAAVYATFALALLSALNGGARGLVEEATAAGVGGLLGSGAGAGTLAIAALVATALAVHADVDGALAKTLVGIAHAAVHLGIVIALVALTASLFADRAAGIWVWAAAVPAAAVAGYLLGSLVFAAVLLLVHLARGARAPHAANEVFASQALTDWKNLLRLRLGPDGRLTVFALGVDRVCTDWDVGRDATGTVWLSPSAQPPVTRPIDEPQTFAPPGAAA